jgi:hypothetical protein
MISVRLHKFSRRVRSSLLLLVPQKLSRTAGSSLLFLSRSNDSDRTDRLCMINVITIALTILFLHNNKHQASSIKPQAIKMALPQILDSSGALALMDSQSSKNSQMNSLVPVPPTTSAASATTFGSRTRDAERKRPNFS